MGCCPLCETDVDKCQCPPPKDKEEKEKSKSESCESVVCYTDPCTC